MAIEKIKIDNTHIIELRKLDTGSNYNKGVRLLTNNVVVYGYIAKDGTTNEAIKTDALEWLERKQDNSLLQSLLK